MAMLILVSRRDIEKAQQELITRLEKSCDTQIPVKVGYRSGYVDCSIRWSQSLGLWFHSDKVEGSRYWNAFGLSNVPPKQNSMLWPVVEINPSIDGLDKRPQGCFARDDNGRVWLLHRGRIGGGKPGIGRKLFFDNYQGEVREIAGDKFAVIGDISSSNFVEQVRNFVQVVNGIKGLANEP